MRCPDCNRFVPMDDSEEPDHNLEMDDDGTVSGSVDITNTCEECGTELTSASFDVEVDLSTELREWRDDNPEHANDDLTVDVDVNRWNSRVKGKMHYGVEGTVTVKHGDTVIAKGTFSESIAAGDMDSLV